jgi:hypothetical protein
MLNAQSIAMRDPAMAAAMGLIAASNFGHEAMPPLPYEGVAFAPGDEEDDDDDYADFGASFGATFGAAGHAHPAVHHPHAAVHVPRPTEHQAMALWQKHHMKKARQAHRSALLEPNQGLAKKVERYNMQVSDTFVFGTAKTFTALTVRPTVDFRPQVMFANAPTPMFAFISAVLIANVNAFVGTGEEDAFDYNAMGWGKEMDMPTLTPAIPFTVNARYTGFTPPGFVLGSTNTFSMSVKGWASIVA